MFASYFVVSRLFNFFFVSLFFNRINKSIEKFSCIKVGGFFPRNALDFTYSIYKDEAVPFCVEAVEISFFWTFFKRLPCRRVDLFFFFSE